jgi:hypothetical protein
VALWNGVGFYDGPGTVTFEAILLGAGNGFGLAEGSVLFSYGDVPGIDHYSNTTATVGLGNGVAATTTLAGYLGSNADGEVTESQAQSLSGRSFLFSPTQDVTGAPRYNVTEITVTTSPVPAPPAVVLVGIGGLALIGRRRMRRRAPVV